MLCNFRLSHFSLVVKKWTHNGAMVKIMCLIPFMSIIVSLMTPYLSQT